MSRESTRIIRDCRRLSFRHHCDINFDEFAKSQKKYHRSSFRRRPESSCFSKLCVAWIPAFAGMTTFYGIVKFDEFVISQKSLLCVIPAKAGIQLYQLVPALLGSGFTEVTTFYESVKFDGLVKSQKTPLVVIPAKAGIQS